MTETQNLVELIELSNAQVREKSTKHRKSLGCRLVFCTEQFPARQDFLRQVYAESPYGAQAYTQISQRSLPITSEIKGRYVNEYAFIVEYFSTSGNV